MLQYIGLFLLGLLEPTVMFISAATAWSFILSEREQ